MSITFSNCEKLISWETTPSIDLAADTLLSISLLKIFTDPPVLVTKVPMMPIVDDLPAPLGPNNA